MHETRTTKAMMKTKTKTTGYGGRRDRHTLSASPTVSALLLLSGLMSVPAEEAKPGKPYWWQSGAEQTKDRMLKEAWWIWNDKDIWGDPERGGPFVFTRDLELGQEVRKAEIRISAEKEYILSINDRKVGQDDQPITLDQYDITSFLKKGRNHFRIWADTNWWNAGVFVCATVELADGTKKELISDRTWRIAKEGRDETKPAGEVARGVDGGTWNNVGRMMVMPDAWYRLNTAITAPGIAWAKPFAGKRLKVLAIHPRGKQRDTVELMHRTDMDVAAVFPAISGNNYKFSHAPFFPVTKGLFLEDAHANLEKALAAAPDVIIWGGFSKYGHRNEDFFYQHIAEPLRSFVREGGGLVYVYGRIPPKTTPTGKKDKRGRDIVDRDHSFEKELTADELKEPEPFLALGTPFEKLPGFYGTGGYERAASLYRYGKGRIARLRGVGSHSGLFADRSQDTNDLHYEYYMSFAIKSVLWAASEMPAVQFVRFPNSASLERNAAERSFGFALKDVPEGCEATLTVRSPLKQFRLPKQPLASQGVERGASVLQPIHEATADVQKAGEAQVRFELPKLAAGDYFADVVIRQNGKVANWGAASLTVEDELRIADVLLDKEFIDVVEGKRDEIRAEAVLSRGAPANSKVRFALLDNYDRLLATQEIELETGVRGRAAFSVDRFCTTLGKVRAELLSGDEVVDVRTANFTTIRRDWDRFTWFAWTAGPSGHQGNLYLRVLAKLGLDASEYHNINFTWLEAADRVALPSYPFPRLSRAINDLTRLRDSYAKKARQTVEAQYRYDPIAFTRGNEFFYGGGDEEPDRVRDFQGFLEKKYQTIAALNKEWDADYKYFEDVYPLSRRKPEDLEKLKGDFINQAKYLEQAETTRNYSRFVDQWLNNYRVYYELAKISLDNITAVYPHARLGFDCPMWPHTYSGHDWQKVMSEFGFFAPYGRGGEIIPLKEARSYLKPGQFIGLTYGGYLYMAFNRKEELIDCDWHRWRLWNGLMQGFSSIWWYTLVPPGAECNLGPGFEPFPTLETAAQEIATIRKGYYTLFNRIRRKYGPIALHDSIISRIASGALPQEFASKSNYGHCMNVHVAMHLLESLCGHQYTFVSDPQIVKGELSKYKVLVMPTSFAIGADETKALAKFVRDGGTVIADVRPGLFDGSGRWDDQQAVPALFGLSYGKELGRKLVKGQIRGQLIGHEINLSPEQPFPVDPALELKGATALCEVEGVPIITVNEVGKGKAICLNIPFTYYSGRTYFDCQYAYWGHPDHNELMTPLLDELMNALSVERPVRVDVPEGERWPFGLEIACLPEGQAEYIGLTKKREYDEEPDRKVVVHASKKGHLYDMLNGEYLGEQSSWEVPVKQVDVRLFAVLPYELDGLAVTLEKEAIQPGEALVGTLKARPTAGRPVRHVVNLQAIRPDGKTVRYLSRNLETEKPKFSYFPLKKLRGYGRNGQVKFELPMALNEPTGTWRLLFTDVATGMKVEAEVRVAQ